MRRETAVGSPRPDEVGGYRWSVVAETSLPTSEPPAGDLTGRLLAGRYRLTGRIASGGMAQVWEAIVMELVRGTTLRARLDEHGALDVAEVLGIGAQVADALGAAHQTGLVHRDIK